MLYKAFDFARRVPSGTLLRDQFFPISSESNPKFSNNSVVECGSIGCRSLAIPEIAWIDILSVSAVCSGSSLIAFQGALVSKYRLVNYAIRKDSRSAVLNSQAA